MAREPYPDNTRRWPVGALVIHRCDAKMTRMLMRVTGYTDDDLCETVYVTEDQDRFYRQRRKRTVWRNDIKHLLDPADFGLTPAPARSASPADSEIGGDHAG